MNEELSKLALMIRKAKYFSISDRVFSEVRGGNMYIRVGQFDVILYDDGRITCGCQNSVIYAKWGQLCAHKMVAMHYVIEQCKDIRRI